MNGKLSFNYAATYPYADSHNFI